MDMDNGLELIDVQHFGEFICVYSMSAGLAEASPSLTS